MRGGGLGSAEMAKALYVRGMAYKKQSKPGLAISDLTSALWLKNGLGDADQKSAIAERAEAYRLAGLGDGNTGEDSVSVADPNPAPAGAKAAWPLHRLRGASSAVKTAGKAAAAQPRKSLQPVGRTLAAAAGTKSHARPPTAKRRGTPPMPASLRHAGRNRWTAAMTAGR